MKSKGLFYLFAVAAIGFMVATGCEPTNPPQPDNNSLVGKWAFVDRDGVTLEITQSEIMLMPVIPNPTPMETRTYSWVSSDTIEITQRGWGIYITRNKVIFHTNDRVTIEGWFVGNNEVDAPVYEDVTLVRIGEPTNNCDVPFTSTLWASVDNLPLENIEFNRVYVINSFDDLQLHRYFFQDGIAIPDFTDRSIIVNYFSGCAFCDVKSAFCNENGYNWDIVYYVAPVMCVRAESFITYKIVDKIPENATVSMNANFSNCTDEPFTDGNVLMLKVDYLTNTFEGGYEFSFDNIPNSFNIRKEYRAPGDFGYIKYYYYETSDLLFYGTIIWMGEGEIYYPQNLLPASVFDFTLLDNIVFPNGFEDIGVYSPLDINYTNVWLSVENLAKVREYLAKH